MPAPKIRKPSDTGVAEGHAFEAIGKDRTACVGTGDSVGQRLSIGEVERGLKTPDAVDKGEGRGHVTIAPV